MNLCPSRLEPIFKPRPWGAVSLAPLFPEKTNLAERIGEAWMTGGDCVFANGPYEKRTLADVWPEMPSEWAGTSAERGGLFPLLVKFIFAEDKLSVQVHPDDDYASRREQAAGGRGKTEMWYALQARPDAQVLVGLKPGITPEKFGRAIREGTAEECLERVPLHAGEAVFIPAGTAHTIGAGLILCEIQQHSDITYRVHDYGRRDKHGSPRELHIEKALEVMRFGDQHGGKVTPPRVERDGITKTYLAACRYFLTAKWEFDRRISGGTSHNHFDLLIFLEGKGSIAWANQRLEYEPAQTWMLPAALGAYELAPEVRTSVLHAFVPADLSECIRRLAAEGVDEATLARLVYP